MLGLDKDLYSRTTIYIPGLDNIRTTRCVLSLINPINKMYGIPEKKTSIKLKYKVRNSKKTKLSNKKTKEHMKYSYMYVYTYDFRRGVVTGN